MNIVLIAFVMLMNGGTDSHFDVFPDMASCEATKAKVVASIADYNASSNPNKVTHMALVCAKLEKALQGKDV